MFGMTLEKVLVVLVLAAVIVGPHRLPAYAQRLAAFVRGIRSYTEALRGHVEREVGTPLAIDDWRSLDPRQYDPRRIVREALVSPAVPDAAAVGEKEAAAASAALSRERANHIAALSPGGWRPADVSLAEARAAVAVVHTDDDSSDALSTQADGETESVRSAKAVLSA